MLASHLVMRVYWRHWKKTNRLKLLDVAQESLKIIGMSYDKGAIKRLIESQNMTDEKHD
jgi:hypothetical protein